MKILRVIDSMNPSSGGPCQGIRNSITELEKLGIHNEVVCLDDPNATFLKNDSFPIHALGTGISPWHYNKNLLPWLKENIDNYDSIIIHGLWLYHSYAVKYAIDHIKKHKTHNGSSYMKKPTYYVMPHGMLDPYFQQASGRKLKAVRNWLYWKLIESNVVNEAEKVLFTCETELQLSYVPFSPYRPKDVMNIGYGITPPPPFSDLHQDAFLQKCPALKNRPYFLFLSRIHEKKGVDILINAYARVIMQNKSLKSKIDSSITSLVNGTRESSVVDWPVLVIAGPGLESDYGKRIQHLAVELNHGSMPLILFPGMLSGDAKWGAFYGCEAFILPSHQENFGIAVAEALACSKPVLISKQVNIWKEIVQVGGGFVANDSLEGTIELLESWQQLSTDLKKAMKQNAKAAYEQFFSIKPHVLNLLHAIQH